MRNLSLAVFSGVLALASFGGTVASSVEASAATIPNQSLTLSTNVSDHADSGTKGDFWANEKYTFKVTMKRADQTAYPASDCGAATGNCYKWLSTETFSNGSYTTIPGVASPRTGANLGVAITGPFSGWVKGIVVYSSWKGVYANQARVPANLNDGGTKGSGDLTVSTWPRAFFGASAHTTVADFGDGVVSTYRFQYDAPFGSNPQCPHTASQWIDSVPWMNDGAATTAGDILAPTAASGC